MHITTTGSGISIFSDFHLEKMVDAISPDLTSENYYDAFSIFIDMVEKKLDVED